MLKNILVSASFVPFVFIPLFILALKFFQENVFLRSQLEGFTQVAKGDDAEKGMFDNEIWLFIVWFARIKIVANLPHNKIGRFCSALRAGF